MYIIHFILYTVYYIALFPFQILSWFASSQMWPMSIKSIIFCSSTDCINFLWILCKMYMKIPNKKSSIIQFISLRFRLLGHLIQWSLGHCRIIVQYCKHFSVERETSSSQSQKLQKLIFTPVTVLIKEKLHETWLTFAQKLKLDSYSKS